MQRLPTTLLLASAALFGCASGPRATLPQLQHRATYELSCPAPYLQLGHVDPRTKIVSGCGRTLVYVEECMTHGSDLLCSWRADTPSIAQLASPIARGPMAYPQQAAQPPALLPPPAGRPPAAGTPPPSAATAAGPPPAGRVYRTHLYDDGYEHLEHRTIPPTKRRDPQRKVSTDLFGDSATPVPSDVLDGRE